MSKTAWGIMCVVGAVVMAAIAIVSAVMGGCPAMLELASGNSVPMKCHWTFVADMLVGVAGVIIALLAVMCKEQSGRRAMALAYIVMAIIAACMPTSCAIGLCAKPEMQCHSTAAIVWALCAVAVIVGVVQVVKANPAAAELPKKTI